MNTEKCQPNTGYSRAIWAHVLPFAVWIAFILVFQAAEAIGCPLPRNWTAPAYAIKSTICAALLIYLAPWKYYAVPRRKIIDIASGTIVGILVAFLWIFPETSFAFSHLGNFTDFYNRWMIMPPLAYPDYFRPEIFPNLPALHPSLAYAPEECGIVLTIAKLAGSAFVISVAEEYFFRGFLYRWLRKNDFLTLPVAKYDAQIFWLVVLVFGLEHDRFVLGATAGAIYGFLILKTGRIFPAVIAHAATNLALGIYVIQTHQYGFW